MRLYLYFEDFDAIFLDLIYYFILTEMVRIKTGYTLVLNIGYRL